MIRLENADFRDFLPTVEAGSVDLVLADPPYEISRKTGFASGGVQRFNVSTDFGEWDHGFDGMGDFVRGSFRCLRDGGTLICFYDLWKITELAEMLQDAGFKQLRFLEWLKTNPVPLNSQRNYLTNAREVAVAAVKGAKPTFNSFYDNGVYSHPICREISRFHPTQKPIALIRRLVEKHSDLGDTVLDPFSGSGTTAAACMELGRSFTGCEMDEGYWMKSMERLGLVGERVT